MAQSHGSNLWRESAGSGATPSASHVVFQLVGAKWAPVVATDAQARLLDVAGTGKYTLIDVRSEYALTQNGLELYPTAGGTAAAVMAKPGAKYLAAAIGAVQAAVFYANACTRKLLLVPVNAAELLLVQVSGKIRAY
jgi:hypothetical protein